MNIFYTEPFFGTNDNINYSAMHEQMEHHCESWDKPLVLIICGAYRMGVSIPDYAKKNIGFVYDYATGSSKTSIVATEQGLLGRVTGYWNCDEWCDITIYINEKHYQSLKACYVEHATSTPMVDVRKKFQYDENGDVIGIIHNSDCVEIPCIERFDGQEYNALIKAYLEGEYGFEKIGKSLPNDIIWIPGRRSTRQKPVKLSQVFSKNENTTKIILRNENNLNHYCYTTLYEMDENVIKVLFGKIVKGKYVSSYDENKKIISTLTT